jgi:hypothetical protein
MIEKSFLPVRLLNSDPEQFLAHNRPQGVNPFGKRDAQRRNGDKKMNMIGHEYVAPDGNAAFSGSNTE